MAISENNPAVRYEGPQSSNVLAFKTYDKNRPLLGKPMADWCRFAVSYGQSFDWPGKDMFGEATLPRPWIGATEAMAAQKCDAAFDFFVRLGVPYFTVFDLDAMAEAHDLAGHETALRHSEERLAAKIAETGVKLLWGGANLHRHPRYAAGAATSCDPEVFAYAAAQVRLMLETTHRLGGENFALTGCREGYDTILNTDLGMELDHLGRFLAMVVEHKHKIGFQEPILIAPKPFEPSKHQYGRDVATVFGFLQRYSLLDDVKVGVAVNSATLAGFDFEHEIAAALALGVLGTIDINRGDPRNGWTTAQFPVNAQDLTPAMILLLESGGLATGGFAIEARLRRQSVEPDDLLIAHIGGIDTVARALLAAENVIVGQRLAQLKRDRYAGWSGTLGQQILSGESSLETLADTAIDRNLQPQSYSGRQELAEAIIADSVTA